MRTRMMAFPCVSQFWRRKWDAELIASTPQVPGQRLT